MAEKLFTVDLNLGNNKAKNFRLEDFSTNPSSDLQSGRVIYFTGSGGDQNHFRVYNGTAWKTLAFTDDVPSIAIELDAATGFTVTGSPAGASGTLEFEWDTVAPGYVLAGLANNTSPAPGNSIPAFRALDETDIPVEIARVDDIPVSGTDFIAYSEKGEPSGVAELNASGVVPAEQLDLSGYQPLDTDLTNIAGLTGTAGLLYTDGANTWSVDTSDYLTSDDLSGVSATVTGTANQIDVSDTGTNDYVISLNPDIIIGGAAKGKIHLKNASDVQVVTLQAESNGDFGLVGDANVVISGVGGEYLNLVGTTNQIATIGDIEALDAYDITSTQISNWDTAYGWGDHGSEGYLTTAVESISNVDGNITFSASTGSVTADLSTNIEIDGTLTFNAVNPDLIANTTGSASIFDSNLGSISIGSGVDVVDIGSSTGTVTLGNDLVVTGDLTVNGDVTTLNTATMNVEDNIFVLNSNVTGTPTTNAGLEVERGDYTNASIYWNESANKWYVGTPVDTTDAAIASAIARKYVTTTTGTTHTITHNLNTSDVTVNCWLSGAQVEAAIVVTDANTVTVTTNSSITNLKTVVVG